MVKYKISKNIILEGIDVFYEETPSQYKEGFFILRDGAKKRSYLVNETVCFFINKFSQPKTQEDVIQEIKTELQSTSKAIEETCHPFFEFLLQRKILVPENKEERTFTSTNFYKEGDRINRWTVLELISNKRNIDIYTVFEKGTDPVYIIKLLNTAKIGSATAYSKELRDLEREYYLLEKAKAIPAVSRPIAFEKDASQNSYIVLEYIEGKGLSRFFNSREGLKPDFPALIENTLAAFASLHQNNLIHGDIHPSNVMVNTNNTVRIIDLGFSRDAETEKNEVLKFGGVNFYMPPERINLTSAKKFSKEPDLYSDVYQIGLLVYLGLYNTLPFKGFIWEELAQNIKQGNVVYSDITFWNDPVPDKLIGIMQKCLNTDPGKRYKNACEILEEFKKGFLHKSNL